MDYTEKFFDEYRERRGTRSVKWDDYHSVFSLEPTEEVLPMWVADMDFAPPVEVTEALAARAASGMLGYTMVADSVYKSIINWIKRRHGWEIEKEWIVFTPGVVTGINIAYQQFSNPGDGIIVQPPVYYPFMHGIRNNGRRQVINQLTETEAGYEMNLEELKKQIHSSKNKVLILCNPHNPVGKCWDADTLEQVGSMCAENDVVLISDEIHADLMMTGHKHQTVGTLSDKTRDQAIVFFAPSKTFNLAGLQTSYAVIPNAQIRHRFVNGMRSLGIFGPNTFGQIALETAYTKCEGYVDAVCRYIDANMNYMQSEIHAHLPGFSMRKAEGTYLAWVDARGTGMSDDALQEWTLRSARIGVDFGSWFGPGGEGFLRFNLACPRETVTEALRRMKEASE